MDIKQLYSGIAIALTLGAYYPYMRSIMRGTTRPHVFSWVIWGTSTVIIFVATLQAKGGAGAWAIGVSGLVALFIAALAYVKKADITITRLDWLFFITAMLSLPFWYLTDDALWAVAILTLVDVLGFGPTMRKVWDSPQSESPGFYAIFALRNAVVILALESYTLTTVLFPAGTGLACVALIAMLLVSKSRQ